MKTQTIEFTQFLFPNRREERVQVERPIEIARMADAIKTVGFRLEIENNSGTIWMSASDHTRDLHYDRIVPNGPEVPPAIDSLITETFRKHIPLKHD